jgi:large subunit ribosomal protein L31e
MADKLERLYVVPLRRGFLKAAKYKRSSKSIRLIKEFLKKHMKTENVLIGKYLNEAIWKNGPKNPPSKVNIKVVKENDIATAEIIGAPEEAPKEEPKKKTKAKKTVEDKEVKTEKKEEKVETKVKVEKKTEKVPTASELKEKKE